MKRQSPEDVPLSAQSGDPEVVYKILRQLRKAIQTLRILLELGFEKKNEAFLKFKILKQQNLAVIIGAWGLRCA